MTNKNMSSKNKPFFAPLRRKRPDSVEMKLHGKAQLLRGKLLISLPLSLRIYSFFQISHIFFHKIDPDLQNLYKKSNFSSTIIIFYPLILFFMWVNTSRTM